MTYQQERKRLEKVEIREFECKLIIEVKSHICLYAKDDPTYSNRSTRQAAWEDISSILGRTVDECQKKWTSLRDSFRSYFRMDTNVPSGSGSTQPVKWIHFQSLRFLIPYVKVPADDCGNFSEVLEPLIDRSSSIDTTHVEEFVDVVGGDNNQNATQNPTQNPTQNTTRNATRSKKRKTNTDETFERVLNAIENVEKRKPMEVFMDSVAQQVEHFSQRRQISFQRKILDLLADELANEDV